MGKEKIDLKKLDITKSGLGPSIGKQTIFLKKGVHIIGNYSIVGGKEGKGPFGKEFHKVVDDEYFGEKSHEDAEQKMFEQAIKGAIKSSGIKQEQINMMFSGDLLDQITSSSFAAREYDMPFVGIYGACSTMALTLSIASCLIDSGVINTAVVSAGSHYATAERQYRTPLELGNQRPPTSHWTVTGVGASVLERATPSKKEPKIRSVTFGKVVDWGSLDANNMGAVMAPAAAHTLVAHFRESKTKPSDYSAIYTGDLGKLGGDILRDLLGNAGYSLGSNYVDCGAVIYHAEQTQYQGGSGCGCSAVSLNSYIMKRLKSGKYKRVLFVATGALLSPTSSFQGNTIPGIAHCVEIEGVQ